MPHCRKPFCYEMLLELVQILWNDLGNVKLEHGMFGAFVGQVH